MPKNEVDYSQTIIYKLCCKDPSIKDIYVGHTTNFKVRKNAHKKACSDASSEYCNQYVYKFIRANGGWDNWSMIEIDNLSCENKREAEKRERYWIETLVAKLNSINPIATKEEKIQQKKDWYEENKEAILEKAKQNYEENKDKKLEYQKQYAEEHKEHIAEKQKEYRENNKEKLAEQKKVYRDQHKEESAKAQKEWREANKEKLKEQKSEVINCECGSQYTFGNKHRHLQTKIHISYQNKLCGIIEDKKEETEEEKKAKEELAKQKSKEYREKNSDKIKEYKKVYNAANKEHIKQQRRNYYENHKEEILEKSKEYVENNKEMLKKTQSDWYQKNKEIILQKRKATFVCECGSEIRCSGRAEHFRSEKHKQFIEQNKLEQTK